MNKKFLFILIYIALLLPTLLLAELPTLQLIEQAQTQNKKSYQLYYNASLAYAKAEQLAQSRYYLAKAYRIAPRVSKIRKALSSEAGESYEYLVFTNLDEALIIAAFFALLTLAIYLLSRRYSVKRLFFIISVSVYLLALSNLIWTFYLYEFKTQAVLFQKTSALEYPYLKSTVLQDLESGTFLRVLDQEGEYYQICVDSDDFEKQGWVLKNTLKIID